MRMHILFSTAMLMASAGMIAGMATAFALPAVMLGAAQAMAQPRR
jgi:hypothetical protein